MTQLYVNEKAEKNGITKAYERTVLSQLNNEYSDYVFQWQEKHPLNYDFQSRFEWVSEKLNKLYRMRKRSLISASDFNQRRATIDKFIFNK